MQSTDQLEVQTPEQPDPIESRIRALEKRMAFLEGSFQELVRLTQQSEISIGKKMLAAISGAFHHVSEELADVAQGPKPADWNIDPVAEGTEQSIIVKRTGDQYDFSTSIDPAHIQNQGTEQLAQMIHERGLVEDGETRWFRISVGEQGNGAVSGADQASAA